MPSNDVKSEHCGEPRTGVAGETQKPVRYDPVASSTDACTVPGGSALARGATAIAVISATATTATATVERTSARRTIMIHPFGTFRYFKMSRSTPNTPLVTVFTVTRP